MAAKAILHCWFHEHQETDEDALCLDMKKRGDWDTIHEENYFMKMAEEAANVKKLRQGKHTSLVMRTEHPRAYEIC